METQLLLFLFVIEQFLFLCGFLSFVSHESTAGTTILTLFLAETPFCKHSLKVESESRFSFSDNEKSTICFFFFFLLGKISKTHSQVLLNANAPLTSPYISVFFGTFQELLFLHSSSHLSLLTEKVYHLNLRRSMKNYLDALFTTWALQLWGTGHLLSLAELAAPDFVDLQTQRRLKTQQAYHYDSRYI